jgi:hypothetical protein
MQRFTMPLDIVSVSRGVPVAPAYHLFGGYASANQGLRIKLPDALDMTWRR